MPTLKPNTILPTAEEDTAITSAAMLDADATPLTDKQWTSAKKNIRLGRPKAETTKERITIRLSPEVVAKFRATGDGWQTRIDAALKDYLATH